MSDHLEDLTAWRGKAHSHFLEILAAMRAGAALEKEKRSKRGIGGGTSKKECPVSLVKGRAV